VGLLAFAPVRRRAVWVLVPGMAVVSAAFPIDVAWPGLAGLALVTAATVGPARRGTDDGPPPSRAWAAWPRSDLLVPVLLGLLAVGWAAGDRWSLAAAAAITAAVTVLVARRVRAAGGTDLFRVVVTQVTGLGTAALALWAAAVAVGAGDDLALGLGLGALFALTFGIPFLRDAPRPVGASLVLVPASALLPIGASDLRAAGVLLLLAATGWSLLAAAGWRYARWLGAALVSAGTWALLADAEVTTVEAYTSVPTVALTFVGLWELREDRARRTLPTLGPALVVALLPSLVVLARDPQALARTLGLLAAAGVLGLAGSRLRWSAPVLAAASTAVVVALTQLSMVVDVVPRWVTTALVGILLVYLAATYERQHDRARTTVERLRDLR
jgi:hypothetical protein